MLLSIRYDVFFLAVSQRPDNNVIAIVAAQLGGHGFKAAAVKHIKKKRFYDVVAMMAQRYFIKTVFLRIAIQRATPQPRTQTAGCFTLGDNTLYNRVGIALYNMVINTERLQVLGQNMFWKIWLFLIQIYRSKRKINWRAS